MRLIIFTFLLSAFAGSRRSSSGSSSSGSAPSGAPPSSGSSGSSGSSSSGGQNFHVTFGDNCEGSSYDLDTNIFVNSFVASGGTYNYYAEYWVNEVGVATHLAEGFCSTSEYLDNVYSTPYEFIGPTATSSGSVTSQGHANHDMENYCSAEGSETPPLMESDFTETSYSISMSPSNEAIGDISNTVGVAVNGIVIFSPYTGVNTVAPEDETLDTCVGHPANGNYHYHGYPPCLAESLGDSPVGSSSAAHSSILGWAYDGFPIYGPWGYADPMDMSSEIINVRSGYQCSDSDDCTDYNNWSFAETNGELDQCNGRFTKTPEFPEGMYVYVFSVKDSDGSIQFPGVPYCTGSSSDQSTCASSKISAKINSYHALVMDNAPSLCIFLAIVGLSAIIYAFVTHFKQKPEYANVDIIASEI